MTDDEIRKSWSSQYPNWREDGVAAMICRLLCELIAMRARSATTLDGTAPTTVEQLCLTIGIPQEQFDEVQKRSTR